jgi:hypothetical protein
MSSSKNAYAQNAKVHSTLQFEVLAVVLIYTRLVSYIFCFHTNLKIISVYPFWSLRAYRMN